jgi:hypothetical protein
VWSPLLCLRACRRPVWPPVVVVLAAPLESVPPPQPQPRALASLRQPLAVGACGATVTQARTGDNRGGGYAHDS